MPRRLLPILLLIFAVIFTVPLALAQEIPPDIIPTAIDAANAAIPGLGQPNEWRWQFVPNVRDSALSCPLVTGAPLEIPVTVYQVTLVYGNESYNVFVSVDATRVQLCDSKFPGLGLAPTNTPSPTPSDPTATPGACLLTPTGAFANVRSAPALEADILTTITEHTTHTVLGRSTDNTWYLIEQGWVSSTVVVLSGDCSTVPSLSSPPIMGSTSAVPTQTMPGPTAMPEGSVQFGCPVGSDLYMPTRIQTGAATARIETGGIPNRLRAEPSTSGAFIADIQPGRTLDRVIAGPACNEGYVWWQVEIDGQTGWTAESDGNNRAYFIEPVEGFELAPGRVLTGAEGALNSLVFAPDGESLRAADSVQDIVLHWDLADDEQITPSLLHGAPVGGVAFLPNGMLASAGFDGRVRLWQPDGTQFALLEGVVDPKWGTRIVFSPDGALLAAPGCAEPGQLQDCILGQARVFDVNTGEVILTLQGHSNAVYGVAFSPDGSLITTFSADGVWLWDAETSEQVRVLPSAQPVNAIAFHPEGAILAAAGCTEPLIQDNVRTCNLGEVRLWDVETGSVLAVLEHPDEVWSVAFNPDGTLLATGGEDTIVRLWEVESEAVIASYEGHRQRVRVLAFSGAGDLLASGSDDQTVRLWEVETE